MTPYASSSLHVGGADSLLQLEKEETEEGEGEKRRMKTTVADKGYTQREDIHIGKKASRTNKNLKREGIVKDFKRSRACEKISKTRGYK